MKVIKHFISTYKRSIRDFSLYKEVVRKPFFFTLRFLYSLTFIVLFINTLLFAITTAFLLPSLPKNIATLQKRLETLYPEQLVVTIQDGTISTNQKEPIYFDIPEVKDYANYEHFLTINTKLSSTDYIDSKSVILVVKDAIIYPDVNNTNSPYRIEDAENLGNARVDYNAYHTSLDRFNVFLETLPSIAPWILVSAILIIPLFGSFMVTAWRMLVLAILTGILLPISSIFGNKFTYGELYRMGMVGLAVPITLSLILNMIGVFVPMVFASCFLLWMVIVLSKMDRYKS